MFDQNNQEHESFDDEQEIEISDLSEGYKTGKERHGATTNVRKIALSSRYTPQQKRRRTIIISSIILVVLSVFLVSMFPMQTLLPKLLPSDKKQMLSGDNLFYFPEFPSWGEFTLDGQSLKSAPMTDSGPPIAITRGTHVLQWRGEPFAPLQCELVVPPVVSYLQKNCIVRPGGANEYTKDAWIIAFRDSPSLEQLPLNEQKALKHVLQDLLDKLESSEMVQVGERYSYQQNGQAFTAKQPLQATQRFVLDTNIAALGACKGPRFGADCTNGGSSDCRLLCTLNWPIRMGDATMLGWHIAAVARQNWEYTPQDKQVSRTGVNTPGDQYLVTFQVTREHNQWHAAFHPQGASPFDDPNCIGLVGQLTSLGEYQQLEETQQRITWSFSSGSNRASGCLATGSVQGGTSLQLPASSGNNVYLLYRFNQLQAASEPAHLLWPTLPFADKHVQDVAAQIANHAVFVS
ncbi:hypothetical protein [Reticulibacter mediterranei]|nr:hypothetical protein [Reticulibacter mediterranei]